MTVHASRRFGRMPTRDPMADESMTIAETAGMFGRRPARKAYLEALDAHWKPFLDGNGRRGAALRRMADDLAEGGAATRTDDAGGDPADDR